MPQHLPAPVFPPGPPIRPALPHARQMLQHFPFRHRGIERHRGGEADAFGDSFIDERVDRVDADALEHAGNFVIVGTEVALLKLFRNECGEQSHNY